MHSTNSHQLFFSLSLFLSTFLFSEKMSHDISDMFPSIVSASPIMQNSNTRRFIPLPFSLFLLLLPLPFITATSMNSTDGSALSSFIASADPTNKLSSILNKHLDYCKWVGVQCKEGKVVRLVFENLGLQGSFSENTLTKLDQLRVLSLKHNKLTGPIPNLSPLSNLKTLFIDHNSFTGNFPVSILSLHRIRILDLSHNDFTGKIPQELGTLEGLYYLKLDWNSFNGTIPPLNQSSLIIFNVSNNNLTGPVPITVTLSSFNSSSFLANPGLCGRVIGQSCKTQIPPFFTYDSVSPKQEQLVGAPLKKRNIKSRARAFAGVVFGVLAGVLLVILLMGFWVFSMRKRSMPDGDDSVADSGTVVSAAAVEETALSVSEITLRKMQSFQMAKSGTLMFCAGETQIYSLDSLMRGSAEMLGRGTIGVTYKAVLENQLIVSVKRVESQSSNRVSKEMFESHMEMVGSLRHPNLVPLRAYFQAKEERLLIYDYQPNGSLFSLIHGSRSSRAKPLHWTSCLKIAEDVAQGLAYIHQASRLVHGNLKSSNVLLGPDFEACVTDFGLTVFEEGFVAGDSGSGYRAPETRKSNRRLSSKSDVYSFGVLLLELVTGKTPSQAFSITMDLPNWVRSVMEEEGGEERTGEKNLVMLLEIAMACVAVSPDQRPTMRQVLKMIEEIKELEMGGETIDSSTFPNSLI